MTPHRNISARSARRRRRARLRSLAPEAHRVTKSGFGLMARDQGMPWETADSPDEPAWPIADESLTGTSSYHKAPCETSPTAIVRAHPSWTVRQEETGPDRPARFFTRGSRTYDPFRESSNLDNLREMGSGETTTTLMWRSPPEQPRMLWPRVTMICNRLNLVPTLVLPSINEGGTCGASNRLLTSHFSERGLVALRQPGIYTWCFPMITAGRVMSPTGHIRENSRRRIPAPIAADRELVALPRMEPMGIGLFCPPPIRPNEPIHRTDRDELLIMWDLRTCIRQTAYYYIQIPARLIEERQNC